MEAAEASSRVETAATGAGTTRAPAKGVGAAEKAATGTGAETAEAKTKLGAVKSALREEEAWDAT